MLRKTELISLLIQLCFLNNIYCLNKYSEEANVKFSDHFDDDPSIQIRDFDKPFRMYKLNLFWSKAKLVNALLYNIISINI